MNKKPTREFFLITILFLHLTGCVGLMTRVSPSLIPNLTRVFFEECDQELARIALPADLKLMEGLLESDPENRALLTALCMGFTGYAMLFVEEVNPERASQFYIRARDYGLRALGRKGAFLKRSDLSAENIRSGLIRCGKRELQALFCTTLSWQAWINLNLDQPLALAQAGPAQSCLERVLEIDPAHFYGAPYILMGTILAEKPGIAGGDAEKAKAYFDKAVEISQGRFLFAQYHYAKYYAVRTQNKELFLKLIQEINESRPDELSAVCLINTVMKQKAKKLMAISQDLFF